MVLEYAYYTAGAVVGATSGYLSSVYRLVANLPLAKKVLPAPSPYKKGDAATTTTPSYSKPPEPTVLSAVSPPYTPPAPSVPATPVFMETVATNGATETPGFSTAQFKPVDAPVTVATGKDFDRPANDFVTSVPTGGPGLAAFREAPVAGTKLKNRR